MSETIFPNSLIFQEFAKLKYTLNLKISKSQNLTNAKISRPKVGPIFTSKASSSLHQPTTYGPVYLRVLQFASLILGQYESR